MNKLSAIVRNGKIEPLEPLDLPEGTQLSITINRNLEEEEWTDFCLEGLSRAYGDDEPDYEILEIKERGTIT